MASFRKYFPPRAVLIVASLGLGVLIAGELLHTGATTEWTPRQEREPVFLEAVLKTLDGERLKLDSLRGKVVMLNFWATWCGPCREEMPSMARLHDKFAKRGLQILAVTEELPETIKPFLERSPYPFQIVRDPGGELTSEVGILVLPSTLLIDRDSKLVVAHQGMEEWDRPELLQQFEKLLSER